MQKEAAVPLGPGLQSHTSLPHILSTYVTKTEIDCTQKGSLLTTGWGTKMAEGMNRTWVWCYRGPEEEGVSQVSTQNHSLVPGQTRVRLQLEQEVRVTVGAISQDSRAEREIRRRFAMTPFEYLHQKKWNKYVRKMWAILCLSYVYHKNQIIESVSVSIRRGMSKNGIYAL